MAASLSGRIDHRQFLRRWAGLWNAPKYSVPTAADLFQVATPDRYYAGCEAYESSRPRQMLPLALKQRRAIKEPAMNCFAKPLLASVALFAAPLLPAHAQIDVARLKAAIETSVEADYPKLDALYKDLHAHPEVA